MPGADHRLPHEVLAALLASDAAAPRITCYDDTPGPTAGERIELSARVLSNWVNKAANALQEELDVEAGDVVRLDLPPHWRTAAWALATWQVGACVALDDGPAEVLVTTDPTTAATHERAVLVTLAALARSSPETVPPGVLDDARELSTFGDAFLAVTDPDATDPGLREGDRTLDLGEVVPTATAYGPGSRVHVEVVRETGQTPTFLRAALGAWAAGGSVVLSLGAPADRSDRARAEGVTAG